MREDADIAKRNLEQIEHGIAPQLANRQHIASVKGQRQPDLSHYAVLSVERRLQPTSAAGNIVVTSASKKHTASVR